MNIFEKASRIGLRFNTNLGQISTEKLWSLRLTGGDLSLDSIAMDVNKKLEDQPVTSFVNSDTPNQERDIDVLRLEILKHIINIRKDEIKEKENKLAREAKRKRILEAIDARKEKDLQEMSVEELTKMLEETE